MARGLRGRSTRLARECLAHSAHGVVDEVRHDAGQLLFVSDDVYIRLDFHVQTDAGTLADGGEERCSAFFGQFFTHSRQS